MQLINIATRQRLEAFHPEAAAEIANLELVLDSSSLNPDVLTLCADYVDATLAGDPWETPASAGDLGNACLDVCEQFMISVADIREEQIRALRNHLTTDDVYNLMSAIYLIEMSRRLDHTLERVLS